NIRDERAPFGPDIPAEVASRIGAEAPARVDRTKVEPPHRSWPAGAITPRSPSTAGLLPCWRNTIFIFDQAINFFDYEHDTLFAAFGDLDLVASFADQVRNVDHRQRIGTVNFKAIARLQRLERLARFERRQRTFQSRQVK